ncbi:GGDEF domain-containing protein [Oxalicibacterium solurbis]|uniref:diguanylate cyclase n=1 Tax=Oxalicibacterium solurbis TaxID=69280 RepID=A0A8J3AYS7_9BURK|nr:sensor domain-containing diguanylate cyclase [Oxalicibacterium solurbis]GGI54611.1 GGDEF domain-containing protein [Oxalicibacterium solurbis]
MTTTPKSVAVPVATDDADALASDAQLLRIQRIGERLFNVAHCVVTFADASSGFHDGRQAVAHEFCRSLAEVEMLTVVQDASADPLLATHPMVSGEPRIRFHASSPIRDAGKAIVGAVHLVDYRARSFSEIDRRAMADLVGIAERELHVRSLNAIQLDLEKKNKTLRRKSLIDPLIGTWNRGAIMRILGIESVRCEKAGQPLSVIVVDLDFFKKINDTYGHPAGDAVLVKVTSRLRSSIRRQDSVGRYGGEEFLAVLPGASQQEAQAIAERMRAAVASEPELIGEALVNLTVSAGVASSDLFPAAGADELIGHADRALYAAKDAGRNCVKQARPDMQF